MGHEDTVGYRPRASQMVRSVSTQALKDIKSFHHGITFNSGDFVSLFSLFFDNLSTLLGFAGAILGLNPTNDLLQEILYQRIIPAAGIMLFVGNCFYTWQAVRLAEKYQRAYTAQPYGFNTAGGFPFIFGIIYGVYFSWNSACTAENSTCTEAEALADENDRITTAWQVCVSANFLTGLINIALGFFGPFMMQYFPLAAMLVPLAGIGFTFLALNQIAANFEVPAIGLVPIFLIFTQYYAGGRFHIAKGWYLPEALPIVLFGCVAGWAYGTQDGVVEPVKGGAWIGDAFIKGFQDIGPYMGVVIPFSIAASFTDMMCLVSAQKAGDPFPIRQTMISDGIGTLIGSMLGSPFGTVVYIGHPVHKKVGAQTGYSIMNGFIYLILCLSGVVPTILSIVPAIAIGPVIMIFGIMICEECTQHIAERHHCVIFFGLFFGITDYIFTVYGDANGGNFGTLAMSRGSALSAMVWCAMLVYTIDRRWAKAAFFSLVAAFFAGLGIIHQADAVFSPDNKFRDGTGGNLDSTSPFEFMMGYLSLGGVCMIYYGLQTYFPKQKSPGEDGYEDDHGYAPPNEEPGVDNLFETWWLPAERALELEGDLSKKTKKAEDSEDDDGDEEEAAPASAEEVPKDEEGGDPAIDQVADVAL